ncbi:hypothetical protein COT78_01875 [Candidatus Berkelbacteria bacterium CG10_big_fil_rev_8_21_14_0_10_43_13]|uniref:Lipoprotein n=1 Tax=Candidatus Berkelbacteria bacterium CG10_big_fil_rev_8_21_14_0_10_43_13 TaxID=1974514 RepID=A0A2H0W6N6_9BACT|nr:MAG: hypothetical protein COT78_01875 [Candidatus Berkelbacteria bacterium CG10_big_fil_rev_8_21_14_0_10_43_13]
MRKLRNVFVLTALCAVVTMLTGCGGAGELFGLRKPAPRILSVRIDRESSSIRVELNRGTFYTNEFACYRIDDDGEKRYVQFSYERVYLHGDNGTAVFVLTDRHSEALDLEATYYVAAEFTTDMWDYSSSNGGTRPVKCNGLYRCEPGKDGVPVY